MTLGSLFDGSGGFCLAGMLNGIEPVWASEIEMFPIRVSTKRIPSVRHYGDVSRLSGADLPPVDIVTFGSPCQDLSTAGLRAGLQDGERSSLFFEAVRVIKEMRDATDGRYPRYAVWENVPGAFSSNGGEDFRIVIETLARVKANVSVPRPKKWDTAGSVMGDGYSIAWRVLDAQYWGVPQRRRRIFLVCDFDGRTAPPILFESEGLQRNFKEGRTPWKDSTTDHGSCAEVDCRVFGLHSQDSRVDEFGDVSETVTRKYGTGGGNTPVIVTRSDKHHSQNTDSITSGQHSDTKGGMA